MRKVRVGLVMDPASSLGRTHEEEVEDTLEQITWLLELKLELVVEGTGMHKIPDDAGLDLLVIDYGGMSGYGGSDTAQRQIGRACEWAEEHTGSLVLLWTWHTQAIYQNELRREFGDAINIKPYYAGSGNNHDEIRSWFAFGGFETMFPPMAEYLNDTPGRV